MDNLLKLVNTSQLVEGAPVAVTVEGYPSLAVYRVKERFFVTDNLCTHRFAPLADGRQDGLTIKCPFHGGAFDIETGLATQYPCQEPLKTYEVVIEDNYVCLKKNGAAPES